MSASVASQFVLHKPGNLGASDPSGISADISIQLYADDDTAEPVGIIIIFDTMTKGVTNYVIDGVTSEDNHVIVTFAEEALE